ncbi:MAG: hypothetical protein ACE3L7_25375 [Candidatus Pristimantibacillus sp.]
MLSTKTIMQIWIDDYLDLLNYAQKLGDLDWQIEIIAQLYQSKKLTEPLILAHKTEELQRRFDLINEKILNIYSLLKATNDEYEIHSLTDEVFQLNLQRIELFIQLKSNQPS